MLTNEVVLTVKKSNDRTVRLYCPPDMPLGELFDSVCEMREFIINRLNEAKKSQDEAIKSQQEAVDD